jgi:hypothetical protein
MPPAPFFDADAGCRRFQRRHAAASLMPLLIGFLLFSPMLII